MDIKPFLHEHHLLFDEYEKNEVAGCDKCNLQIDGRAFTCETCKFWLHESCAVKQLPHEISHPLHSQHHLSLTHLTYFGRGEVRRSFICDKCFSLTRGYLYYCWACRFSLDLICASSSTTNDHDHESRIRSKTIKHFSHPDHELTPFKYRKVGKDDHSCNWCHNLLLSGLMSYACLHSYHEVFFHESCLIDMPTIISKHHFHPSHPLHIQPYINPDSCNACRGSFRAENRGYSCQRCSFSLHVGCVRLQPNLKHELHQHPLTYFPRKYYYCTAQCNICNGEIQEMSGFYRCTQCNINLHLHCLQLPLRTKHKYHRHELMLMGSYTEDVSDEYYCDMCEKQRKPKDSVYVCQKCSFVAHIGCALYKFVSTYNLEDSVASIRKAKQEGTEETNANSLSLLQIENFHHQHPLNLIEVIEQNESIRCRACNVEIFDQAYACKSCEYYLHKTCTALPYEVPHHLHPQHSLKLFTDSELIRAALACYECRDNFVGFLYACCLCDFALDVKCAILSVSKSESHKLKEMERRTKLCPFNQDHSLRFFNFVHNIYSRTLCDFCELPLAGPCYGCISCSLQLHESCLEFPRKILLQFHLHPLYSSHNYDYEVAFCLVCKRQVGRSRIRGFHYRVIEYSCLQCDLHLHPRCVKYLKRSIRSKVHMHNLYYYRFNVPRSFCYTKCSECNKYLATATSLYFCMDCATRMHFECAQIPHSIKSKYHIHPLTLKGDLTEDDFEEYYCDICEQERYPKDHVYACIECEEGLFVAHIDCGINTVEETESSASLIMTESRASTSADIPRITVDLMEDIAPTKEEVEWNSELDESMEEISESDESMEEISESDESSMVDHQRNEDIKEQT